MNEEKEIQIVDSAFKNAGGTALFLAIETLCSSYGIPFVGTFLSSTLQAYSTDEKLKRVKTALNHILDKLKTVDQLEEKLAQIQDYQKPWIGSLLQKTIKSIEEELIEEKRKVFQDVFVGILENPPKNVEEYDEKASFIEILKDLSHTEILILNTLYDLYKIDSVTFHLESAIRGQSGLQFLERKPWMCERSLIKLNSIGLLNNGSSTWNQEKDYKLSVFGSVFVLFLQK
ncbi:MAG: hypothetical protein SFU25_11385 [Candidatus Caenarcaniphilales bacterium]|nr:hypothetical protein [Candidatus Caenarcaniphilales bacterium]